MLFNMNNAQCMYMACGELPCLLNVYLNWF